MLTSNTNYTMESSHELKRYLSLSKAITKLSLTRALQYELLEMCEFSGSILDIGGGDNAHYKALLNSSSYQSVNIDESINPTWITKPSEDLPCPTSSFDNVISINTVEHVYNAGYLIKEMHRVLRKGGRLFITTPFLFPEHGHPDDYFRPTSSWYFQTLEGLGFTKISIAPLIWGPFSTGLICSGMPGPAKGLRKQCALFMDFLYLKYHSSVRKSQNKEQLSKLALAYSVFAEK